MGVAFIYPRKAFDTANNDIILAKRIGFGILHITYMVLELPYKLISISVTRWTPIWSDASQYWSISRVGLRPVLAFPR